MVLIQEVKKTFIPLLFKIRKIGMKHGCKNMTNKGLTSAIPCYGWVKERRRIMGRKKAKCKNIKRNHKDHLHGFQLVQPL